jgi:hypothetical protein
MLPIIFSYLIGQFSETFIPILLQACILLFLGGSRYLWVEGKLKFDFSVYNIPVVGEEIEITKTIKYWRPVSSIWTILLNFNGIRPKVGTKWKVIRTEQNNHRFRIYLESLDTKNDGFGISISDFNFIGKISSKTDIRNQKLNLILNQ